MAKAIGLIGNYTGKLGNTVGYNLKDSNNKQTQGVRVYQPVVKNPRTAGQAEQRAKLAPVNATYRLLKDIIDRGQEGVAYGNKSRLAWLKQTLKSFNGPWFEKGADITMPVLCPISAGSLPSYPGVTINSSVIDLSFQDSADTGSATVGYISHCMINTFPTLKNGDQITSIAIILQSNLLSVSISSFVIDTSSNEDTSSYYVPGDGGLTSVTSNGNIVAGAVIVSREGDNGEHLRSSESLIATDEYDPDVLAPAAKAAAIASYMSQGANTDWAEESIM